MRNIWIITKRELYHFFYSPIAYIVMFMFLIIAGYFFSGYLFRLAEYSTQSQTGIEHSSLFRYFLHDMAIVLLFFLPALTMHLFAEEKKSGTLEILLTKPVQDWEVVVGKFLSAFLTFFIFLGITWIYVYILFMVGKPDVAPILSAYLGMLLVGACFISLGLLASSVTSNQIVAVILGFGLLLLFWLLDILAQYVGPLGSVFSYLALLNHYEGFSKGLLVVKDLVFYLSFIFVNLFITIRIIESRTWR